MTVWKKNKIKELLENLDCTIQEIETGGDYDIPGFVIRPNSTKEWITITPFKNPGLVPNPEVMDNCEIYALEIRTNGDSRGGLQTKDKKVGRLYGEVCAELSKKGFYIIAHYDEIF